METREIISRRFVVSFAGQEEKKNLQSVETLFLLAKTKGCGARRPCGESMEHGRNKKNTGKKVATKQVRLGNPPKTKES